MTWSPKKPFFTLKNLFDVRSSQITLGQHHPPPLCPPHLPQDLDQMSQDGSKLIKFSLLWHTMEVLIISPSLELAVWYNNSPMLCMSLNHYLDTVSKMRPFGIKLDTVNSAFTSTHVLKGEGGRRRWRWLGIHEYVFMSSHKSVPI